MHDLINKELHKTTNPPKVSKTKQGLYASHIFKNNFITNMLNKGFMIFMPMLT